MTAPGPWIWRINFRLSFERRRKGPESLRAEAAQFRDRAARAEEWLLRIHNEVKDSFFQKEAPISGRALRQHDADKR